MKNFMYVAWFQDNALYPNDEDYHWVACFVVEAKSKELAKNWGDHLSHRMCSGNKDEQFLRSEVHFRNDPMYSEENWNSSPIVQYGQEVSDAHIGW